MPGIVVGVDFGTTYSGVSWAFNDGRNRVHHITNWPKKPDDAYNDKVPSVISYKEGHVSNWGYGVPLREDVLRWVKLLLEPHENHDAWTQQVRESKQLLDKLNKTAEEVVRDYLRQLWGHAKEEIRRRVGDTSWDTSPGAIVVLTVPAVWSHVAKDKMLQAAKSAGLPENIQLLTEPEAAALATLHDRAGAEDNLLTQGDAFVVCDAGGGIVELASYKINRLEPLQMEECTKVTGGLCGSVSLDVAFEALVKIVVGHDQYSRLRGIDTKKMMNRFEIGIKRCFTMDETRDYAIDLRGVEDDESRGIVDETIILPQSMLRNVFYPVCRQVEGLVQHQINQMLSTNLDIKAILLVGGFGSRSKSLHHLLQRSCSSQNIAVLQLPRGPHAVCTGACLWGLEHAGTLPGLQRDRRLETPLWRDETADLVVVGDASDSQHKQAKTPDGVESRLEERFFAYLGKSVKVDKREVETRPKSRLGSVASLSSRLRDKLRRRQPKPGPDPRDVINRLLGSHSEFRAIAADQDGRGHLQGGLRRSEVHDVMRTIVSRNLAAPRDGESNWIQVLSEFDHGQDDVDFVTNVVANHVFERPWALTDDFCRLLGLEGPLRHHVGNTREMLRSVLGEAAPLDVGHFETLSRLLDRAHHISNDHGEFEVPSLTWGLVREGHIGTKFGLMTALDASLGLAGYVPLSFNDADPGGILPGLTDACLGGFRRHVCLDEDKQSGAMTAEVSFCQCLGPTVESPQVSDHVIRHLSRSIHRINEALSLPIMATRRLFFIKHVEGGGSRIGRGTRPQFHMSALPHVDVGKFSDWFRLHGPRMLDSGGTATSGAKQLPPVPLPSSAAFDWILAQGGASATPGLTLLLHRCAILVQFISLVIQSNIRDLVAPLDFSFLEHGVDGFTLTGILSTAGNTKVHAWSGRLSCLGSMLGHPVLVFGGQQTNPGAGVADLVATPSDLLSVWGPGRVGFTKRQAAGGPNEFLIKYVRIGGGTLAPAVDSLGQENVVDSLPTWHWEASNGSEQLDEYHQMPGAVDLHTKIRVGLGDYTTAAMTGTASQSATASTSLQSSHSFESQPIHRQGRLSMYPCLGPSTRAAVGPSNFHGTCPHANTTSNAKRRQLFKDAGLLKESGTRRGFYGREGVDLGMQAGQYVNLQAMVKFKWFGPVTLKETLINKGAHAALLSGELERECGLLLSTCSAVMSRVRLRDVVSAVLSHYDCSAISAELKQSLIKALRSSQSLCQWIRLTTTGAGQESGHVQQLREHVQFAVTSLIAGCLFDLRCTGISPDGKFGASWLMAETPSQELFDDCDAHPWLTILDDSEKGATFATVTDECWETPGRPCGSKVSGLARSRDMLRRPGDYVLSTRMCKIMDLRDKTLDLTGDIEVNKRYAVDMDSQQLIAKVTRKEMPRPGQSGRATYYMYVERPPPVIALLYRRMRQCPLIRECNTIGAQDCLVGQRESIEAMTSGADGAM